MQSVSELGGIQVHYVDDTASAEAFLSWVRSLREPVAIDSETTGLEWWSRDFTRLLQFGTRDEGWAVGVWEWRTVAAEAMQIVVDAGLPCLFHNAKFDAHAIEVAGFASPLWENIHDTRIMHHLLWPHYSHSLKPIAEAKWGRQATVGQQMLNKVKADNGWDWASIPTATPEYWAYAVMDTVLTRRLWDDLYPQVREHYLPQYEREMAAQAIAHRAECRGLRIDLGYTEALLHSWNIEAVALAAQLEQAGIKNPLSNRQVEKVLRDLEWEPDEFTPKGAAKLDKVVLKQLEREFPGIATPLMRYKRITKWSTVYLKKFLSSADSRGYVHASINTMEARTGRMSITGPPLQTLPSGDPAIRTCVLPDDGMKLWAVDYQAQEARLFVNYAKDPVLAEVILQGGDLYTHFSQAVYNDPSIIKSDPRRSMMKVMVLAFFYGAGVERLSLITDLPHSEIADILKRLFYNFPSVATLTGDHAIGGVNRGLPATRAGERYASEGLAYVLTPGGRRFSMEPDGLFKATNGIMQGGGADCIKCAMVRLDAAGLSDSIVVPVHDELVVQLPDSPEGAEMAHEVAKIMEDHSYHVPLLTELSGPYDNWGAKYERP